MDTFLERDFLRYI